MRAFLLIAFAAGCTGAIEDNHAPPDDPFGDLDQAERDGPPRYTSRVHSCLKLRYRTLGNVLASRGVDLAAADELSAGHIYATGGPAFGAPNYAARIRETRELGLATETKLFDILTQAAPEIIANQATRPECLGAPVFDASHHCLDDGVSCLLGLPATPAHLAICNETVARAETPEAGERLAVAVLAAAAHTCE